MPEITIVIPTIGRGEKLERALRCLDAQDGPARFDVIVALDAAASGADLPPPSRFGFPLRVVTGRVAGAAGARNAGWHAAAAPLVLFIDDDVLADPRLVGEHLTWHRRSPATECAVLGSVRWAKELRVTPFMRWLEGGIQFDYRGIEGEEAGWGRFYTANASVKRELLSRVGGFDDERFPFGYEDLDLAYRMNERGLRLLYNRRASAEHLHPMDLDFWRRRIRRIAAAERRFCATHPEIPPYFHRMLAPYADREAPRGMSAKLASLIPPGTPLIGGRVWRSLDAVYRHALAEPFLEAWETAGTSRLTGPDLAERGPASGP